MTAPTGKPANFCSLNGVSPMAIASPLATLPPAVAAMVTLPLMVIAAGAFSCPRITLPLPMAAPPEIVSSSPFEFTVSPAAPPCAVMLGEPASVPWMEIVFPVLFPVPSSSGSDSAPPPMPAAPIPPCAFWMVTFPSMSTSPRLPAPPPIPAPSSPPVAFLISALPLMVTSPRPRAPPPMPAPLLPPVVLSMVGVPSIDTVVLP